MQKIGRIRFVRSFFGVVPLSRCLIVLASAVLLASCAQKPVRDQSVEKAVYEATAANPDITYINIASVSSFEWERCYVFTPYTSSTEMEKQLGTSFKDPSYLDRRDDIYLLVFTDGENVISYAEIPRNGKYYAPGEKGYLDLSHPELLVSEQE